MARMYRCEKCFKDSSSTLCSTCGPKTDYKGLNEAVRKGNAWIGDMAANPFYYDGQVNHEMMIYWVNHYKIYVRKPIDCKCKSCPQE